MASKNHYANRTVGISIPKRDWEAIEKKAKDLGTNPHKLAADAIKNILASPQTENPSAPHKQD